MGGKRLPGTHADGRRKTGRTDGPLQGEGNAAWQYLCRPGGKTGAGIRGAFVSFAEQQSCFLDLSRVKEGYLLKKAPGTELHVGDEIVVQIQREAQKTKLPSATAELSLSGSALALYYGKPEISCSGRLLPEQKKRLKELGIRMFPELSGGSLPFGVIFRTASADASEEEIRQEYLELSENSRGLSSMERSAEPVTLLPG